MEHVTENTQDLMHSDQAADEVVLEILSLNLFAMLAGKERMAHLCGSFIPMARRPQGSHFGQIQTHPIFWKMVEGTCGNVIWKLSAIALFPKGPTPFGKTEKYRRWILRTLP